MTTSAILFALILTLSISGLIKRAYDKESTFASWCISDGCMIIITVGIFIFLGVSALTSHPTPTGLWDGVDY